MADGRIGQQPGGEAGSVSTRRQLSQFGGVNHRIHGGGSSIANSGKQQLDGGVVALDMAGSKSPAGAEDMANSGSRVVRAEGALAFMQGSTGGRGQVWRWKVGGGQVAVIGLSRGPESGPTSFGYQDSMVERETGGPQGGVAEVRVEVGAQT
jgi:hypothetical protein